MKGADVRKTSEWQYCHRELRPDDVFNGKKMIRQ